MDGVNALHGWTGKTGAILNQDIKVGPSTREGFFDKTKGGKSLATIAFRTDGGVFGGYSTVPVVAR